MGTISLFWVHQMIKVCECLLHVVTGHHRSQHCYNHSCTIRYLDPPISHIRYGDTTRYVMLFRGCPDAAYRFSENRIGNVLVRCAYCVALVTVVAKYNTHLNKYLWGAG